MPRDTGSERDQTQFPAGGFDAVPPFCSDACKISAALGEITAIF